MTNKSAFDAAKKLIPEGGVDSPVRAFKSVGTTTPPFIDHPYKVVIFMI